MKFVDEFRDPGVIDKTAEEIRRLVDPNRHYRLMEVCGGHTSNSFTALDAPSACFPWEESMMGWRWPGILM